MLSGCVLAVLRQLLPVLLPVLLLRWLHLVAEEQLLHPLHSLAAARPAVLEERLLHPLHVLAGAQVVALAAAPAAGLAAPTAHRLGP